MSTCHNSCGREVEGTYAFCSLTCAIEFLRDERQYYGAKRLFSPTRRILLTDEEKKERAKNKAILHHMLYLEKREMVRAILDDEQRFLEYFKQREWREVYV